MSPDEFIHSNTSWALFLDVDGTLLDVAETPLDVRVPEAVKQLLLGLTLRLDGALALISGRSLADIDRLFTPLRFCASGVHGCELRDPTGCVSRAPIRCDEISAARAQLESLLLRHEGLLLEDKQYGLAVHFRRVPHLAEEVHDHVNAACLALGNEFVVQAGKCVYEIRPAAWTKGTAIFSLMMQEPFEDRTPIYVGDDCTDEYAFAAVNEFGGISVVVGEPRTTHARYRVPSIRQVIRWLENLPPPFIGHA